MESHGIVYSFLPTIDYVISIPNRSLGPNVEHSLQLTHLRPESNNTRVELKLYVWISFCID